MASAVYVKEENTKRTTTSLRSTAPHPPVFDFLRSFSGCFSSSFRFLGEGVGCATSFFTCSTTGFGFGGVLGAFAASTICSNRYENRACVHAAKHGGLFQHTSPTQYLR